MPLTLWWCKQSNGVIVEHETTRNNWQRHQGHVRCIPVGYATDDEYTLDDARKHQSYY
jgi:hypothetical protein